MLRNILFIMLSSFIRTMGISMPGSACGVTFRNEIRALPFPWLTLWGVTHILMVWATLFPVFKAESQEVTSPLGNLQSDTPSFRSLDANLYMQTSAEYRAACYQAFQLAELRLKQSLLGPRDAAATPVVILDLDETVLDNRGFQSWMLQRSVEYQTEWFHRWEQTDGEQVGLIPGAKEFIQSAKQAGVKVVYISNRNERFRSFTKATLDRLGIGISDESELKLSTMGSDKTQRREEVSRQDHCQVLLNIGDNLRDFDEKFKFGSLPDVPTANDRLEAIASRLKRVDEAKASFGTEWIILPNPAYGEWNKVLGRGEQSLDLLSYPGQKIGIAFWNVENLFDLEDDPNVTGDEEFTPDGPNRWTKERLEIKLSNLASLIGKMFDGRGPDAIGLAEIENRAVLEGLVDKLRPLGRDYKIVHQDSPSERGIDCALLYDAKLFKNEAARFHHVDAENTRDIVEARLSMGGREITLFVNHWPSRAHDPSFRATAAMVLRERINQLTRQDPFVDLLVMGDFNDHPVDPSIKETLGAVGKIDEVNGNALFNSSYTELPDATTGTYVYDDKWEVLDQIILSPGLLLPGNVSWTVGSTTPLVLLPDQLFDPPGQAIPRPSRSYTKDTFHREGYSDHLPVATSLQWQSKTSE